MIRIGSLCSGYRGLDMAIEEVFGGTTAWVSDIDAGANKILAHHWPTTPNIGDLTTAKWDEVEPVDILTAGFPCQPFSLAGRRLGQQDERWLWDDIARAVAELRPRIVFLENVPGLLTAPGRQSDCVCGWNHRWGRQLGHLLHHNERPNTVLADAGRADGEAARAERAVGGLRRPAGPCVQERPWSWVGGDASLGDLRNSGSVPSGGDAAAPDCEEGAGGAAAGDAWPQVAGFSEWARDLLDAGGLGAVAEGEGSNSGAEPSGDGSDGRGDCPACGRPVDDPANGLVRRAVGDVLGSLARLGFDAQWITLRASDAGAPHHRRRLFILATAADAADLGHDGAGGARHGGHGPADDRISAADTASLGRGEGRPEPTEKQGRLGAAVSGGAAPADADGSGRGPHQRDVQQGQPDTDWGRFLPAIRQWEHVSGRRAPRATDDRRRLSPAFVEWMMGLPAGHVTAVPGMTRTQQLKALGNGVVPQQAAAALRLLADRAAPAVAR